RPICCCFREIHRVTQNRSKYDTSADWHIRFSPDCVKISNASSGTNVTSGFLEIQCTTTTNGTDIKLKEYIASVVPPEIHTNKTRAKVEYWHGERVDSGEDDQMEIKKRASLPPNVLILGIDSTSRLHMYRSLKETKEFLMENDFVEMRGYTKTGVNTFPNMMSILGGMEENHYPCWKDKKNFLDDCPLIWKNFSSSNYITALLEDSAGIANFNYMKTGFLEQPTDYYFRPVTVAYHDKLSHAYSYSGCVGGMTQTNFMLQYLQDFVVEMGRNEVPYFLLSWFSTLGHQDINNLKPMDSTFRQVLSDFVNEESYNSNNTIIFFISDHGYRFGSYRETFLGYYEDSLPFFYVRIPPTLKLSHPDWWDNLRINSHRLTSPLDLHATLEDILSLNYASSAKKPFPFTHSNWDASWRQVYSFFEETPLNRSCVSSGVPQLYCRCGVTPTADTISNSSIKFGEFVIKAVNGLLLEFILNDTCVPLQFSKFLYRRELSEGEVWNNFGELITYEDHLVGLEATPSKAHFEARVWLFQNDTMMLIGDVSRINSYKGQNDCIKDYTLKNFCMCRNYWLKFRTQKIGK
ncbi:unnamed protein product, partial [Allacma fusca]